VRAYYFGCHQHFTPTLLRNYFQGLDQVGKSEAANLYSEMGISDLPGAILPVSDQVGVASLFYLKNFSLLTFWDTPKTTSRGGTKAIYILEGHHSFGRMLDLCRSKFSMIWLSQLRIADASDQVVP
jgi:hypothetical protein